MQEENELFSWQARQIYFRLVLPLYVRVGSLGDRTSGGRPQAAPAHSCGVLMILNSSIQKLQINGKNPGQVNLPLGIINRELTSDGQRFVIVSPVTGEKPKRMPRSGRRYAVCPIVARCDMRHDKNASRRGNGSLWPIKWSFSGQRAVLDLQASYVPVASRIKYKFSV